MSHLEELLYRITTGDGEVSDWRPLPTIKDGTTHFEFPSLLNPPQFHVMRLELIERAPFPGPGWYGPNEEEGHLKDLHWYEVHERGEVPAGWVRWSDRRRWL
jgi:hypothetical protein